MATITAPPVSEQSKIPTATAPKQIWPLLAGLRFFFAFVVFGTHVSNYSIAPDWLSKIELFSPQTAVIGFFVVSGFSIAHSIGSCTKGFYRRRFDRIYPTFFVGFLLALVPFLHWGHAVTIWEHGQTRTLEFPGIKDTIGSAFLLNGFLCNPIPTLGVAWTLSIECFFYLLAPLFVRISTKWLLTLVAGSGLLYFNHSIFHVENFILLRHGLASLFLLWPWLLGFVYYRHQNEKWAQFMLPVLCALMISRFDASNQPMAAFTIVFGTSLMIYAPRLSPKAAKVASYLGELSYPLYILHSPILCLLLGNNTPRHYYLIIAVVAVGTIAVYHLIDYPYRKWAGTRYSTIRTVPA